MELTKCVDQSPQGLNQFISLLPCFLALESGLNILSVLVGSLPFVESFISEVHQENFSSNVSLPMFVDLQVAFAMFLFCYAQRPSYIQCNVFPSLGILQHYTNFDVHTIAMLEKLLGSGSFGTTMGHLACHKVIFVVFSGGLGLPLVV